MNIRFVLSSLAEGNMRIQATVEVSTESLGHMAGESDVVPQLQAEVAAADFFNLADNLTRVQGTSYELTVEDGERTHTMRSNNASRSPEELKPLLRHLIALHRDRLGHIATTI